MAITALWRRWAEAQRDFNHNQNPDRSRPDIGVQRNLISVETGSGFEMWRVFFCRSPRRRWPDTLALTFHQGISDLDLQPGRSHWPSEGTSDRLRPPHYCLSCTSMSLHTLTRPINRDAQYNWYSSKGIDHINTRASGDSTVVPPPLHRQLVA